MVLRFTQCVDESLLLVEKRVKISDYLSAAAFRANTERMGNKTLTGHLTWHSYNANNHTQQEQFLLSCHCRFTTSATMYNRSRKHQYLYLDRQFFAADSQAFFVSGHNIKTQ